MKKILLIMLLTFSTMANAGEGRYTIAAKSDSNFVWILDSTNGKLKYCYKSNSLGSNKDPIYCSKWKDTED